MNKSTGFLLLSPNKEHTRKTLAPDEDPNPVGALSSAAFQWPVEFIGVQLGWLVVVGVKLVSGKGGDGSALGVP